MPKSLIYKLLLSNKPNHRQRILRVLYGNFTSVIMRYILPAWSNQISVFVTTVHVVAIILCYSIFMAYNNDISANLSLIQDSVLPTHNISYTAI
jgi:hypothetical protein